MMITHAVDGIIAVDTAISDSISVPVVMVSGHRHRSQAISVELDHMQAARQALGHLKSLGHSKIAFIKGQAFSSDTALRWKSIRAVARELDIPILPQLVTQLQSPEPGSEPGHLATQVLLERKVPFSAIFAFNDLSAIGAIHALQQASLRVPKDVSIVGFDDILFASTCYPPLTTVRQPLREMGRMAADTLLGLIRGENGLLPGSVITVHPELIIRKSTARHVD
jgi:LacI family transcriptional regulator